MNFNFFKKKQSISEVAMQHLIYDAGLNKPKEIFDTFDKIGIVYDETETTYVIFFIISELCRNTLSKNNDKMVVGKIIDKCYESLLYGLSYEDKTYYESKLNDVKSKIVNINEMGLYRLLLELLDINEAIIEKLYVSEILFYVRSWITYSTGLDNMYTIQQSPNNNEYIDFRF